MLKKLFMICALLTVTSVCSAQLHFLPFEFDTWLKSPAMRHATVAMEIRDIATGDTLYQYDEQRFVQPASLMKLVTTGAALRLLGGDAVVLDTICCIDTTAVPLPELNGYNPDWMIEDVASSYMRGLTTIPDVGHVLRDFITKTNQESLNENAEMLVYWLGRSNRLSDGLDSIKNFWQSKGLETESLVMYDGCGLAPNDRVTAHFMTELLMEMKDDLDFRNSLAVAGQSGTVKLFLKNTRLDGKAQLKTGTTKSVVAYAGYVTGSNNRTYAMSMIVNNHSTVVAQMRKNIEKMLLFLIP